MNTISNLIQKIEVNDRLISTIIGFGVLLTAISFLFSYWTQTSRLETKPEITTQETQETQQTDSISPTRQGEVSSTAINTHTVAAGETLWSIAENYYEDGFSWHLIAQANQIDTPESLSVDQKLNIPVLDTNENRASTDTDISNEQNNYSDQEMNTYTVQHGDYLWEIAEQHFGDGHLWTLVWKHNQTQVPNPDILPVGITLTLPPLESS